LCKTLKLRGFARFAEEIDYLGLERSAIILAGGMSKEFDESTVLELEGKPLLSYVVEAVQDIAHGLALHRPPPHSFEGNRPGKHARAKLVPARSLVQFCNSGGECERTR
jgi:hypothetical protein